MLEFWIETLKPSVFWTALAAIGTLMAVLVALLYPLSSKYFRNNRIEALIEAEIKGNFEKIRRMTSKEDHQLPRGQKIGAMEHNDALVKHVDLRLWEQYRYILAAERPVAFQKYQAINRHAEGVLDAPTKPALMRLTLQVTEAQSYVAKFEEAFGKQP
ncbi:hypothetical protein [Marinobacter persicus]|nr:hypothetical protein [Marinobacter persicus]GHD46683.1 hypothetical protein GCM10008110_13620 [Marinobacter persicus]